jgi:transposase-like protein
LPCGRPSLRRLTTENTVSLPRFDGHLTCVSLIFMRGCSMTERRKTITRETKLEAVRRVRKLGEQPSEVATALGTRADPVRQWIRLVEGAEREGVWLRGGRLSPQLSERISTDTTRSGCTRHFNIDHRWPMRPKRWHRPHKRSVRKTEASSVRRIHFPASLVIR